MIENEADAQSWLETLPEYDDAARARLALLVELLREENRRQNLISASSLNAVWRRHVADSAQLLTHVPRGTSPWMDLGTGAGFPGLVIAALRPEIDVRLVEARRLRAEWLSRAVSALGLSAVTVIGSRIERLAPDPAGVISARAFAPVSRLLELSARFSTSDTIWVLPKGRSAQQEVAALQGWKAVFHVERSLTDAEAGIIVGNLLGKKERVP